MCIRATILNYFITMFISQYATLWDVTKSETAVRHKINNTPSPQDKLRLTDICSNIYDPLCVKFGRLFISSGFRNKKVNSLVGGSPSSQHVLGSAIDIDGQGDGSNNFAKVSNVDLFLYIKDNLIFDQLIAEFETNGQPRWVHVSYSSNNRNQVLIAIKNNLGQKKYSEYSDKLFNKVYNKNSFVINRNITSPEINSESAVKTDYFFDMDSALDIETNIVTESGDEDYSPLNEENKTMLNVTERGRLLNWILEKPVAIVILIVIVGYTLFALHRAEDRNIAANEAFVNYIKINQVLLMDCYKEQRLILQDQINKNKTK